MKTKKKNSSRLHHIHRPVTSVPELRRTVTTAAAVTSVMCDNLNLQIQSSNQRFPSETVEQTVEWSAANKILQMDFHFYYPRMFFALPPKPMSFHKNRC